YSRGSISISGVAMLGTAMVLTPGAAMIVGLVGASVHAVRRRPKFHRAVFNAATFALAGAAGGAAYHAVLGRLGSVEDLKRLAASLLAGAVFTVVNLGLISVAM